MISMKLCHATRCIPLCNHCTHGDFNQAICAVYCKIEGENKDPCYYCDEFTCRLRIKTKEGDYGVTVSKTGQAEE